MATQPQQQTAPSPPPVKAEGAPGWAWLLLVVISLTFIGWDTIPRVAKKYRPNNRQPSNIADTLECGDRWVEPHKQGRTYYIVLPSSQWSNIVYRPNIDGILTPKFWINAKDNILIQFRMPDGTWTRVYKSGPADNTELKGVTAVRFMNESTRPVLIELIVS